jgi:hypothetical protein
MHTSTHVRSVTVLDSGRPVWDMHQPVATLVCDNRSLTHLLLQMLENCGPSGSAQQMHPSPVMHHAMAVVFIICTKSIWS